MAEKSPGSESPSMALSKIFLFLEKNGGAPFLKGWFAVCVRLFACRPVEAFAGLSDVATW